MKVTLQKAVIMTGKSESTIRRDRRIGKVSGEKDARGHLRFDKSELMRVYGISGQSTEQRNDKEMNGHDRVDMLAVKDNLINDLRAQLEIATTEKTKLLDLLSAEKENIRALMPPPAKQNRNWLSRLVGNP